jgi:hypothetical protein
LETGLSPEPFGQNSSGVNEQFSAKITLADGSKSTVYDDEFDDDDIDEYSDEGPLYHDPDRSFCGSCDDEF